MVYKFNAIPVVIPVSYCVDIAKKKVFCKAKKRQNSQHSVEESGLRAPGLGASGQDYGAGKIDKAET